MHDVPAYMYDGIVPYQIVPVHHYAGDYCSFVLVLVKYVYKHILLICRDCSATYQSIIDCTLILRNAMVDYLY